MVKAVGVDGISAEVLKILPWRGLQKIKNAFELRYRVQSKENIETWLRNFVLIPKKKVIDRLEGQTRGICVQSVLAKSGTVKERQDVGNKLEDGMTSASRKQGWVGYLSCQSSRVENVKLISVQHDDEWGLKTTAGKVEGRKDGSQDEDWWRAARKVQS